MPFLQSSITNIGTKSVIILELADILRKFNTCTKMEESLAFLSEILYMKIFFHFSERFSHQIKSSFVGGLLYPFKEMQQKNNRKANVFIFFILFDFAMLQ